MNLQKTKYFDDKFTKLKNNTNSKFQDLQLYYYDFIIKYIVYLRFSNYTLDYFTNTILQLQIYLKFNNFTLSEVYIF